MSVGSLVSSGPLLLAIPVAAAAGAVTFLSPCVLPLVPGYLSYITGMSGASVATGDPAAGEPDDPAEPAGLASPGARTAAMSGGTATAIAAPASTRRPPGPPRRTAVLGASLFVLGFSALFAVYGAAIGWLGAAMHDHQHGLSQILGVVLILLGLLFAGVFDRFLLAGRIARPSWRPKAGLAGAPLLGVMFGLTWTPCIGPTLSAVLGLAGTSGTASRGALLAFTYGIGIGIPFLIVAFAFQRGMNVFGFAKRHARLITAIGGTMLVIVGVLEITGTWQSAMSWLQVHWTSSYTAPI
jgi:cytochrome c-type biogenesis protein